MWEIINLMLSDILQVTGCNYILSKLTNEKINYKKVSNIIGVLLLFILFYLVTIFAKESMIKPLFMFAVFTIVYKYIYKITYKESAIYSFIIVILYSIIEIITLIIFVLLLRVPQTVLTKYIQLQPIMGIICLLLIYLAFRYAGKYLIKIKNIFNNDKFLYFFYITGVAGIGVLSSKNFNNLDNNLNFIINIITIIIFLLIIFFLIKEKLEKQNVYKQYDNLFKYLKNTESLLEKYQKYNHENKNQLIYIKNIAKENKEIKVFIDSILEDENKIHKDRWIKELKNVPSGGIKGFLSYKINYMIDQGIKVNINVSPRVKKYEIKKKKDNFQKNICRILGVYLDNAYQACKNTTKKEITIEMLIEKEKLVIIISNSYEGKINLEEIGKEGYTTKGKGHGFGLSLVNDIISSDKSITQKREVINNFFYQYLFIKK